MVNDYARESGRAVARLIRDGCDRAKAHWNRSARAQRRDLGWLPPEIVVRALYVSLLGRDPDPSGAAGWVETLERGVPLDEVIRTFDESPERAQVESRRQRVRPSDPLSEPTLTIVDVGAQPLKSEDDIFRPMIDAGGCRVIGFEPDDDGRADRQGQDRGWTLRPDFVGDGRTRRFYETKWGPTSSLYEPDVDAMIDFVGLADACEVSSVREVATVRLDDVINEPVEFLKIDVQGAELDVLTGARRLLGNVLAVHLEVEFFPIYRDQPLFDQVFRFLTDQSFELFDFTHLQRYQYQGGIGRGERVLWGEAVFVPDRERLDRLSPESTMQLVRIMRDCYGAVDFCKWLVNRSQDRPRGERPPRPHR